MEKVYTLNELKEMKKATIDTAFATLAAQMKRNQSYTARELSAMTGGLLSTMSIATRSTGYGWRDEGSGRYIKDCGRKNLGGARKTLAELDANGNIIRKFTQKLPDIVVNTYKIYG